MSARTIAHPHLQIRARLEPDPPIADLVTLDVTLAQFAMRPIGGSSMRVLMELEQAAQETRRLGVELSRLAPRRRQPVCSMFQTRSLERLDAAAEELQQARDGLSAWPALLRAHRHIVVATNHLHAIAQAIGQE